MTEAFKELWLETLLLGSAAITADKVPDEFRAIVINDLVAQYRARQFQARALRWFRRQQ